MSSLSSIQRQTYSYYPPSTSDVPDDILFSIFTILVQNEAKSPKYSQSIESSFGYIPCASPARYPWTLAAVCKRWRAVCLQCATLWSFIDFISHECTPNSEIPRPPSDFLLMRTLLQLERSRGASLSIHIDLLCSCNAQLAHWDAVRVHSERWRGLRLNADPKQTKYFRDLTSNASILFPNLTRLHYIAGVMDTFPTKARIIFPPDGSCAFTNLRSLMLSEVRELESDLVGLPWHQLTSLTLDVYGESLASLIMTLSKCHALSHLSLSLDIDLTYPTIAEIEDDIPKDSVTVPHLTSLSLGCSFYPWEKRILPFLRLPSLRYLVFGFVSFDDQSDEPEDPEPCDTLIDLIVRSGCVLTELSVHFLYYDTSFPRLLGKLSELQYMHMDFEGDADSLRQILCPARSPYPCASLEHLTLNYHPPKSLGAKELYDVIKSRLNSPVSSPLKSLQVVTCSRIGSRFFSRSAAGEEWLEEDITDSHPLPDQIVYPDSELEELPRTH